MKKYYIQISNEQQGPFSIEELKDKGIKLSTPVWHEGLEQWTTVKQVAEVKKLLTSIPPPLSSASTAPPPTPQPQAVYHDPQPSSKKKVVSFLIMLLVLSLAAFGGYYLINNSQKDENDSYDSSHSAPSPSSKSSQNETSANASQSIRYKKEPSSQEKVESIAETEMRQASKFLKVDGNYNFNLTGRKVKIRGTIANYATAASFKDVVVRVTFLTKTNTKIGSEDRVLYEDFPPNSQKEFYLKVKKERACKAVSMRVIRARPN